MKGRKIEYRNNQGVASGKFNKQEIFRALVENSKNDIDWIKFIAREEETILASKVIHKPIEDINDAVTLYLIASKAYDENDQDFEATVDHLRNL